MSYSFLSVTKLEGPNIMLRPLRRSDLPEVARALVSPTTWFSRTRDLGNHNKFINYFEPFLARQEKGESLTLVAQLKTTKDFVAMSTFQYPGAEFRKVEIGFTWIADQWQRTFVNSEMKYLMLKHAFEDMKTKRVEFSVHPTNEKSNTAMHRLGATFEGTLRKWRLLPGNPPDDGNRNIYSFIEDEWPQLQKRLLENKAKHPPRPEFIRHWNQLQEPDNSHYKGSDELLSIGSPLGKKLGLTRLGIHHEVIPPGRRTSWPHAESAEEEFGYVIEGHPDVWIDGVLHRLSPGDAVGFPAGTGISHTFINNTETPVRMLVVGEKSKPENKIVYPLHPEQRERREDWWADHPRRELGDHDGLPDKLRAAKTTSL